MFAKVNGIFDVKIIKAGLKLLKMHPYQFKEYLTVDAEKMILRLIDLCDHKNVKVTKKAFPALEGFVAQVANELTKKVRDIESDTRIFKFLLTKFKDIMETSVNSKNRMSIAIRSFGQFASPMNIFLGQVELKKFLISLFKLSDNLFTKYIYEFKHLEMRNSCLSPSPICQVLSMHSRTLLLN
jgi:hypothetical protein